MARVVEPQIAVSVPVRVVVGAPRIDLDEADAALYQPAGKDALAGKVLGRRIVVVASQSRITGWKVCKRFLAVR